MSRAIYASKRVDFKFSEAHTKFKGDQPVRLNCGDCGARVYFSERPDRPQDRFYCWNTTSSSYSRHFDKTRFEIEHLSDDAIKRLVKTEYLKVDVEQLPVKLYIDTDGVTSFTKTRPMNDDELAAYYKVALEDARKKIDSEVL